MKTVNTLQRILDSRTFGYVIQCIVCVSVSLYLFETDLLKTENSRCGPIGFLWAERTIAGILTLEYIVRLFLSNDKKHYLTRNRGIIDFLAIFPFWLGFFVPHTWLGAIRACRILRLMKFYRYNEVMQRIFNEFRKHDKTIKTLAFLSLVLILFMSCVVHECEREVQPELFGTVAGSMWYSFISVTTIGYGDMYPKTTGGKVAAVICIIVALAAIGAFLSVINTVIHGALDDYDLEENQRQLEEEARKCTVDEVVNGEKIMEK